MSGDSASSGDASDQATPVAPQEPGVPGGPSVVDIEKLTEKVYRLLLAEARLERARRGGRR